MVDTDDTRRTTDDGRRTTDDGRRTTPRVWHKLPTGELKISDMPTVYCFLKNYCKHFLWLFLRVTDHAKQQADVIYSAFFTCEAPLALI